MLIEPGSTRSADKVATAVGTMVGFRWAQSTTAAAEVDVSRIATAFAVKLGLGRGCGNGVKTSLKSLPIFWKKKKNKAGFTAMINDLLGISCPMPRAGVSEWRANDSFYLCAGRNADACWPHHDGLIH